MLYFINPNQTRARAHKRKRTRVRARAKVRAKRTLDNGRRRRKIQHRKPSNTSARFSQKMGRFTGGVSPMARRRRHRKPAHSFAANPGKRRRRYHSNPRRRYRRNPGLPSIRGLTATIMDGAKDGLTVVGAQVVTRKLAAGLNGMLPATVLQTQPAARGIATRVLAAVATALIARRVLPGRARLATAGAFAEAVNFALAQNTTIAPFLSAYPIRVPAPAGTRGRVGAYPRGAAVRAGMGAMPIIGLPRVVGV